MGLDGIIADSLNTGNEAGDAETLQRCEEFINSTDWKNGKPDDLVQIIQGALMGLSMPGTLEPIETVEAHMDRKWAHGNPAALSLLMGNLDKEMVPAVDGKIREFNARVDEFKSGKNSAEARQIVDDIVFLITGRMRRERRLAA